MKFYNNYVFLIIFFLSMHVLNAQITNVIENDRGDKREISIDEKQIIEINSKLEVSIDKTKLLKTIKEQYPQFTKQVDLDAKIALFKKALDNQTIILEVLEKKIPSLEDKEQYYDLIIEFLELVIEDEDLENRYIELEAEFAESFPNAIDDQLKQDTYIFSNLNNDLSQFKTELDALSVQKYTVSLLAFKKDKQGGDRVHVQNFDNYTERDYVTVERWVVNLSEDQKKKLAELADKAKENNEKALTVFEALKEKFRDYIPNISCLKNQKDELLSFLNLPEIKSEISDAITADANALGDQIDSIISLFKGFDINIKAWSITKPFEIQKEFEELLDGISDINLDFSKLNNLIAAINKIKDQASELSQNMTACINEVVDELNNLKGTIVLIIDQQKNYLLNKEIGKEVLSFSVDNLPDKGFINLKGTGQRKNGDELMLEVVLRVPSSQEGLPEQTISLEQRDFVMQLIGARSVTAVGMILANPNDSSLGGDTDRKFFFAPSASLLLKFGSKNSYFYNDFLDFGVGLNFAAPDFDTDGTPEFGLGLIATAFKDVLSVGYNYNVNLDSTYWFFGINLPFNLPGLPVNPIKN